MQVLATLPQIKISGGGGRVSIQGMFPGFFAITLYGERSPRGWLGGGKSVRRGRSCTNLPFIRATNSQNRNDSLFSDIRKMPHSYLVPCLFQFCG